MVSVNDCIKIGNKYYLNSDVQKILDDRIESVEVEDDN
jgi:hypothetical protein